MPVEFRDRLVVLGGAVLAVLALGAPAEGSEVGLPLIASWRARDLLRDTETEVGPQMFAVTEDAQGLLYVGNNLGVLEFDGRRWRHLALPGRSIALSLDHAVAGGAAAEGVYVGGAGRFGRLEPDANGVPRFVALSDRLPPADRDFTDVWQTSAAPEGVYFRAPERLVLWRDGAPPKSWRPAGSFGIGAVVRGRLYQRDSLRGLLTLDGGDLRPVPGGERFAAERLYVYLPFGEREVLLGSRTQGLFVLDPARSDAGALRPWPTAADARLAECQLYHGTVLADGSFALGTLRCGILIIDPAGRFVREIGKGAGLADDFVLVTYRDRAGDLWVGHNDGLSRVEVPSPLSRHDERTGLKGFVEDFERFDGRLYAATSLGVSVLDGSTAGSGRFRLLPGPTTQFFRLATAAGQLIAASAAGVYAIDERGKFTLLRAGETWSLVVSRRDPERVFLATAQGAAALHHGATGWIDEGLAPGMEAEVLAIAEADDGTLWFGTEYRSDGLLRGRPRSFDPIRPGFVLGEIHRYGAAEGVPPGLVQAFATRRGMIFGSHQGALRFEAQAGRFVPDQELRSLLGPGDLFRWTDAPDGTTWVVSSRRVLRIVRDPHGELLRATELSRFAPAARVLALHPEPDGTVWVGYDDGALRLAGERPAAAVGATLVRRVSDLDGTTRLAAGAGDATLTEPLVPGTPGLRFEMALPSFRSAEGHRFRTYLEGLDGSWSDWRPEARKDYTNLPPGHFVFHAQARDAFGREAAPASVAFTQLPPWYRTAWALAGFGLALAGLVGLGYRLALRRLARRNRELESLVAARTRELEEASFTDALTGARNRRYFRHVLEPEIARDQRRHRLGQPGAGMVLFLIDLDHFKEVNDRHGHDAGDLVLATTAARLAAELRASDLLFRWGGEEFLAVVRDLEPSRGAETAARLLAALATEPIAVSPATSLTITGSIGWVSFPWPNAPTALTLSDALLLADRALYRAKEDGRARAVGLIPAAAPPTAGWKDRSLADADGDWLHLAR